MTKHAVHRLVVFVAAFAAVQSFQERPCRPPIITRFHGHVVHEIGFRYPTLGCAAIGHPRPSISWSPIPNKNRFRDNNRGKLTIKLPRLKDAGVYTCTATNACGEDSVRTQLFITDKPCVQPNITYINESMSVTAGSGKVNLRCNATGNPNPSLTWSPIKNERFNDHENGTLTIDDIAVGDTDIYTCTASNKCGNDSKGTELFVVGCSHFPNPDNGEVKYKHIIALGTIANFYCDPEHELFGPANALCLPNGKWNETLPECLPFRQCPQPKNPRKGRVVNRRLFYKPLDMVHFECSKGHTNVGASYQVCEENLKWSRDGPNCRKKTKSQSRACGSPGDIENGFRLGSSYTVDSVVYYVCKNGYLLQGSSQITCLSSGLWSYPPPTCQMNFQDIDLLAQEFANATAGSHPQNSMLSTSCCTDLIFVLDKSGSVSNADFQLSLQFVKDTVAAFSGKCSNVTFSLVTYSKEAELECSFTSTSRLKQVIRDIRRRNYGPTATRRALDKIRDALLLNNRHCYECTPPTGKKRFKEEVLTYPCPSCINLGSRCPNVCSTLVFLVSDGQSNWAGDPRHAAECLKTNGVEIFSVGVSSHVSIAELRDIASEPLHSHLFLVQNFEDAVTLVALAKKRFK